MSINGSTDESLIQTEYAFPARSENSNGDGWSQVHTKSWHTQSNAAPSGSVSSGFNPSAYRRSTTSVAGSSRTFASSVAERSETSEIRPNGWAKIRAAPRNPTPTYQPCHPMGDTVRETGSVVDAWSSDEEEVNNDDDDDDSDDDTVI
jgi:DNA repair protein RAD7